MDLLQNKYYYKNKKENHKKKKFTFDPQILLSPRKSDLGKIYTTFVPISEPKARVTNMRFEAFCFLKEKAW